MVDTLLAVMLFPLFMPFFILLYVLLFPYTLPRNDANIKEYPNLVRVKRPITYVIAVSLVSALPAGVLYMLSSYSDWRNVQICVIIGIDLYCIYKFVKERRQGRAYGLPIVTVDDRTISVSNDDTWIINLIDVEKVEVKDRLIFPIILIKGKWCMKSSRTGRVELVDSHVEKKFPLYLFGAPEIDIEYHLGRLIEDAKLGQ